jgi:hypothetical protein
MINESDFNRVFKPEREPQAQKDFERGMSDCEKGVKHKDQSDAYNEGYAFQSAFNQVAGAKNDN